MHALERLERVIDDPTVASRNVRMRLHVAPGYDRNRAFDNRFGIGRPMRAGQNQVLAQGLGIERVQEQAARAEACGALLLHELHESINADAER